MPGTVETRRTGLRVILFVKIFKFQNFLTEHDLYFEENYTKTQLLEVLHTRKFEKQYKIDAMARDRGFRVISRQRISVGLRHDYRWGRAGSPGLSSG